MFRRFTRTGRHELRIVDAMNAKLPADRQITEASLSAGGDKVYWYKIESGNPGESGTFVFQAESSFSRQLLRDMGLKDEDFKRDLGTFVHTSIFRINLEALERVLDIESPKNVRE